jgi:hypothetical protein
MYVTEEQVLYVLSEVDGDTWMMHVNLPLGISEASFGKYVKAHRDPLVPRYVSYET